MSNAVTEPANPPLRRPSRAYTATGAMRRVGVELELTGLSIEQIPTLIQARYGGDIFPYSAYEYSVTNSALGDFRVELDYAYLKQRGREPNNSGFWSEIGRLSDDLLGTVAQRVVPLEVVAPPLAMDTLHRLHPLIAQLRSSGARGTNVSAIYAFGLHFNLEMPDTQAAIVLDYLRAFAVAFDWLYRVSAIDISRRVFPYIQPYERRYIRRICDPDYAPSQAELIDDYLAANPSRNRALDMLPLFAWLDRARVDAVIDDPLLKARPTLHYRLPNCEIEQPGWDLRPAWEHWLTVEALAADRPRLLAICADYCQALDTPLGDLFGRWGQDFERYLP
ncbi:amidoligase family protein [Salinisphaera sp. SPP-AMP-43]|uniref:amidoligase family protein n=1 Tax=Salinisphaera sp. SPP-AMP-43 TaxID=3121288 RepID=UPI003C6DFD9A